MPSSSSEASSDTEVASDDEDATFYQRDSLDNVETNDYLEEDLILAEQQLMPIVVAEKNDVTTKVCVYVLYSISLYI